MRKRYYLETNVLYSLVNKIHLFVGNVDVTTSLLAYQEIIWGINEEQYHKRRTLLLKLKSSGLKLYPYLPIECISIAFQVDISNLPIVIEEKKLLWEQVNLVISCDNYQQYAQKLSELYDIDVENVKHYMSERKYVNQNIATSTIRENHINLKRIEEERVRCPEYYNVSIEDLVHDPEKEPNRMIEREMLVEVLKVCNINFKESELKNAMLKYDGKQLVAYILGRNFYYWHRSRKMMPAGKNDSIDLEHLLYLRDEDFVIVSDDRLFSYSTMKPMRINCEDFLKEVSQEGNDNS
ncbi:hypothetical protein ACFP56_00010 [Paenibacillus septentrionalis]|uniref:PIN domain-containing protein n=1 Tax=Paenibacillus septentrionalis TaxID=429342 RepID=A0ABW1UX37_9BACL